MPPQIPTSEPTVFSAGDTVQWTKSLQEYPPADGWALTYAFRGEKGDGRLDVAATVSGDSYAVTITPTQSNLMRPGLWMWAAYVTLSGNRHQVGYGQTRVDPNLAVTNFATDLRSPAKKAYDNALDAWQKVTLGQTVILNGRTYTQHNLKNLIEYVDRCKNDYAMEQAYAPVSSASGDLSDGDPRKIWGAFRKRE